MIATKQALNKLTWQQAICFWKPFLQSLANPDRQIRFFSDILFVFKPRQGDWLSEKGVRRRVELAKYLRLRDQHNLVD